MNLAAWAMRHDAEAVNPASESVTLADGAADQSLIPGVSRACPGARPARGKARRCRLALWRPMG